MTGGRSKAKLLTAIGAALACGLFPGGAIGSNPFHEEDCKYVQAGPPGPRGNLLLITNAGYPVVTRRGQRIVIQEGVPPCGRVRPRVDEIDRIVARETEAITIDESAGAFGPGATPERFGSEIEIEVRSPRWFLLKRGLGGNITRIEDAPNGTVALELDRRADGPSPDPDVWMTAGELRKFRVRTEQGRDLVDARRLHGVPDNPDWEPTIRIASGAGDDKILGGPQREEIEDGPGRDLIRAGGGGDWIAFGPGPDTVYGGRGDDALNYEWIGLGPRRHADVADRLFGPGADFLSDRNRERDVMRCGSGFDEIEHGGSDPLVPGCERLAR